MRTRAIGPDGIAGARCIERSEQKPGTPAADLHRQDRPDQLERGLAAEAQVAEDAAGNRDAVVEVDAGLGARGGAEDRFSLAKRIAELGVVAVEDRVGLHRSPPAAPSQAARLLRSIR